MMKQWIAVLAVVVAAGCVHASASEATFERTLSVSGAVTLHVSTGSGNIHIKPGSDSQVHVIGHVKSHGYGSDENRVKEIAANPPIEQTGSILRIGGHMENMRNISIDYEIEAPAKTFLDASSGSGDVNDDGVGVNAKLNSGSGNITAKGLSQGFTVETGSGNIFAEQSGSGDVKASTGSGNIELKNIHGGLRAGTGSGDIKLGGQPNSGWKITTGSGNVEFWSERAAMDLEASTGSGDIHVEGGEMNALHSDRHNLTAKLHGGGPTVRVETGSGDIRIH